MTQRVLPIVVSLQHHGAKKEEVGGVVKAVCSKFGSIDVRGASAPRDSRAHRAVRASSPDAAARRRASRQDDRGAHHRPRPISGYQELIAKATKKLGRGLTSVAFSRSATSSGRPTPRSSSRKWAAAIKITKEAGTLAKGTPFAKQADAILVRIEDAAKRQIELAQRGCLVGGDMVGALRILETAVEQFAGTESAPRAQEGGRRGSRARRPARRPPACSPRKSGARGVRGRVRRPRRRRTTSPRARRTSAPSTLASGTPLADKATARIEVLAKDPDIKPLFERADRDSKAQADLKAAEALLADGKKEDARAAFKKIVESTPARRPPRPRRRSSRIFVEDGLLRDGRVRRAVLAVARRVRVRDRARRHPTRSCARLA